MSTAFSFKSRIAKTRENGILYSNLEGSVIDVRKLLRYMKGFGKECVLGPLFKLLEATFELLVPLVVANIVDKGIANGDTSYIIKMCLVMVLLGVVGLASSVTAQYFSARAAVGFASRLRHAVMLRTLRLGYGEIDRLGTSTLVTRMTSDINQIQNGVNLTLRLLLRSPFVVFGAMVMAFTIDTQAALVFAGVIPVLCIVVFGYGLNKNGSMKPELYDRLNVALQAARQYPNAYIAVTGGETSGVKGISEAAVMAIWLMNNDIPDSRIILEKKSLSTTENAQNTCAILNQKYPQIKQLAVVTSDYHIALAATVLQTACTYSAAMQGGREMTVVAGASCTTSTPAGGDLSTQAWGISILTGTKWSSVSSGSAVRKEMDADTDDWEEEDQPMDVETDEWYE